MIQGDTTGGANVLSSAVAGSAQRGGNPRARLWAVGWNEGLGHPWAASGLAGMSLSHAAQPLHGH